MFLLRPGWLAFALAVIGFSVLSVTVLAPWQFSRDEQKDARTAAIRESLHTPVRPLRAVLPAGTPIGQDREWRRVELTGQYLPHAEVVVRLRSVGGRPAFEVVTPMRLADGTTVLIDRGYVRPAAGVRVPDYPPPPEGTVTVQGRLRAAETDRQDRPVVRRNGTTQIYAVDPSVVSRLAGVDLQPGYIQLMPGQPGVLNALPLPDPSVGRNSFAYALQWLAFAAMAPLGFAYLAWREAYPGRRFRRRDPGPDDPHEQPPEPHDPAITPPARPQDDAIRR